MEALSAAGFIIGCILLVGLLVGLVGVLLVATVVLSREMWTMLLRRTRE